MSIYKVKEKYKKKLKNKRNVTGVAVGEKVSEGHATGEEAITIFVEKKVSKNELRKSDLVPDKLKGYKTDVVEIGKVTALVDTKKKYRPAPGGVSIGHYAITAGTLGCVVSKNGLLYILSNNHVLANTNNSRVGDPIIQPGKHDGGQVGSDTIAKLAEFIKIDFGGEVDPNPPPPPDDGDDDGGSSCPIARLVARSVNFVARLVGSRYSVILQRQSVSNFVDCALAGPVTLENVTDDILVIGQWSGWIDKPALNMPVKKTGRTTGYTEDRIIHLGATIDVNYGVGVATFEDQIVAGPMSQGGDSGSLVLHRDTNEAVGLLFAGSTSHTIINPIAYVIDSLKINM